MNHPPTLPGGGQVHLLAKWLYCLRHVDHQRLLELINSGTSEKAVVVKVTKLN